MPFIRRNTHSEKTSLELAKNPYLLYQTEETEQTRGHAAGELRPAVAEADRRQLTVLSCDLVGSTALSAQLEPELYRVVVQQYHQTCTEVIQRHEGDLAQYLGDGLLGYFGYPAAHEDDAARAILAGNCHGLRPCSQAIPAPCPRSDWHPYWPSRGRSDGHRRP
jgi:class 3 adenylate cyclase